MELELCLAPATSHFEDGGKSSCFDLNDNNAFEKSEVTMKRKRSFDDEYGGETGGRKTLSLLQWSRRPNDDEEDDDDPSASDKLRKCRVYDHGNGEEESIIVGWPPIRTWRKRILHKHYQGGGGWVIVANNEGIVNNNNNGRRNHSTTFVKVKMEGVAIGRKIDLSLYNSYQLLTNDLINMFARYQEFEQNGGGYTILYQDKRGDWLVAGDVPWMTFIGSARRIEIVKGGN